MARNSKTLQNSSTGDGVSMPLKHRHKAFVCRCVAELCTIEETIEKFLEEFKWDIEEAGVWDDVEFRKWLYSRVNYYKNDPRRGKEWTDLIESIREAWKAGIGDIAIAHKRYRLEQLQREFRGIPDESPWKTLEVPATDEQGRIEYITDDEAGKAYPRTDILVVYRRNTDGKVKVLEEARKEVEGDKVRVDGKLEHEHSGELRHTVELSGAALDRAIADRLARVSGRRDETDDGETA